MTELVEIHAVVDELRKIRIKPRVCGPNGGYDNGLCGSGAFFVVRGRACRPRHTSRCVLINDLIIPGGRRRTERLRELLERCVAALPHGGLRCALPVITADYGLAEVDYGLAIVTAIERVVVLDSRRPPVVQVNRPHH